MHTAYITSTECIPHIGYQNVYMEVSINVDIPIAGWFAMENPTEIFGV